MCNRYFQFLLVGLIIFTLAGCRGDGPVTPDSQEADISAGVYTSETASNHYSWGLWDVVIDPDTGEIEAVPLRTADFNANIVRFLQPPVAPVHMLTIALGPGCEPSSGYWVIDVTLAHPFPEAAIFRGFDVRGIIMTEGDGAGIHDPGVRYSGPGGTRLLNADGYTRWWNMQEFTSYGKILGYTEGARSTPGFEATATVNPYKLFTDALGPEAAVNTMDPDMRATFGTEPGINSRRYEIQFDIDGGTPPIRFVYAVDASWSLPDEAYAPEYPVEAYDVSANCQEAYLVDVPIFEERPYYESATSFGGDAVFYLTIGDWQADSGGNVIDQISHIWVESPTLIDEPVDVLPEAELVNSTHATQVTYRVTVPDCHPTGLEGQYFLITVESAEPDSYMPQIEGDPYGFEWPDAVLGGYRVVDVPISPSTLYFNFGWAKHAGGTGSNDSGLGITSLSDDSVVCTGSFEDIATFGEGESNETIIEAYGEYDIFVARYNQDSTLAWAKHAGGLGWESGCGITSLTDDSTVVGGSFAGGAATFGEGEANETILEPFIYAATFIARYNPDGNLIWARRAGGILGSTVRANTSLSDDSIVVTGVFKGEAKFGEGETNETVIVSHGNFDIFIARYTSDGSLAWAKSAGGSDSDWGNGITALTEDSIVVTGIYMGSATFGEGETNETILESPDSNDIFIARYNADGSLAWARHAGGEGQDYNGAIISLSDDSTVLTGKFEEIATFGEGEPNETCLESKGYHDIFIARYSPEGMLYWARRAGGSKDDTGCGITALSDDSIVVTGYFKEIATFGEGEPYEAVLVAGNYADIFIGRYDQDGSLVWAKSAGGIRSDYGSDIAALSDDSTVVTGNFRDAAIFGEGEPGETVLNSYGDKDIFIARYLP